MQDEVKQAALIVTDADREAYLSLNTLPAKYRDAVMAGEWDKTTGVQAFARHRQKAERAFEERERKLREALEWIRDHAIKLRKGTDDWFELVEIEAAEHLK